MPHLLKSLLLLATLPSLAYAQTPIQAAPATTTPPVATLKSNTRLVVLDVVVTDRSQHPVHNLQQSNFTVLENNTSQSIRHFEEHIYPNPTAAKPEPFPVLPAGIFTNFVPAPPGDSLNVLLLDTLNTPMSDQAFVRNQLKEYLKTARPGTRIAIFGLTSRLSLLQGFTSDPELLKSFIEKNPHKASPLLDDPAGVGGVQSTSDMMSDSMGSDPGSAQIIANLQQFEAQQQTFQLELRIRYTLDAMNLLARYLSGLPGRKNLIWFSGSFPINVFPDSSLSNPFATVISRDKELRETTNLFTLSQVAVYPVDARGLMVSPTMSAANSGSKYVRNPRAFAADESKFFQQTSAEHATMQQMAEQTGGRAFINTNGLSQAVASAIDSGSNYYTLTYAPTETRNDGKFRKLQVRLQQQGYNLSYRRGYFANDPDSDATKQLPKAAAPATPATAATTPSKPPAPTDSMRAAMTRGAPNPSEILFKVRILPAGAATDAEATVAPGNAPNPDVKLSHGPYRRYLLDMAADPRAVLFTQSSDKLYHGDIQTRIDVYDQDGNLIIDTFNTAHANINAATLQRMLTSGIQLHQQISVPVKGSYYLRIGIHDLNSDRIGSVEVPVAAVKNLAPLPAPSAPASPGTAPAP